MGQVQVLQKTCNQPMQRNVGEFQLSIMHLFMTPNTFVQNEASPKVYIHLGVCAMQAWCSPVIQTHLTICFHSVSGYLIDIELTLILYWRRHVSFYACDISEISLPPSLSLAQYLLGSQITDSE